MFICTGWTNCQAKRSGRAEDKKIRRAEGKKSRRAEEQRRRMKNEEWRMKNEEWRMKNEMGFVPEGQMTIAQWLIAGNGREENCGMRNAPFDKLRMTDCGMQKIVPTNCRLELTLQLLIYSGVKNAQVSWIA
jgi:hypothetical protein